MCWQTVGEATSRSAKEQHRPRRPAGRTNKFSAFLETFLDAKFNCRCEQSIKMHTDRQTDGRTDRHRYRRAGTNKHNDGRRLK
jgi:hypothetical protein